MYCFDQILSKLEPISTKIISFYSNQLQLPSSSSYLQEMTRKKKQAVQLPQNGESLHEPFRDAFTDTCKEAMLLCTIILTFGFIYLIASKRNTDKSWIHAFFKYFDFFSPPPAWAQNKQLSSSGITPCKHCRCCQYYQSAVNS
jgi:hypothetical protein